MFERCLGHSHKRQPRRRALRPRPLRLGVELLETRDLLSGITITTTTLPNWTVNQPGYSQTINNTGAVGVITCSETGALPPGLTMVCPSFTTLDDTNPAAHAADTYAYGISGSNIAGTIDDSSFQFHGFYYNGSTYTTLDDPSAFRGETFAYGVSGTTVVGYYSDITGKHGFLYNGSTFATLDDPNGVAGSTVAYGISGSNVVGTYADSAGSHGFLYNGSTYAPLDDPAAASGVSAVQLTNGGSGYSSAPGVTFSGGGGSGATGHADLVSDQVFDVVIDNPGAGYTSPPTVLFSGGGGGSGAAGNAHLLPKYTSAEGISGGNIVGYFKDATGYHGFLYNGSTYTTLDDPAAAPGQTYAEGISGANIVGYYNDTGGQEHGFYYDGSTYTTIDDPSASRGTDAFSISGTNIVGSYVDASGGHGYLYNLVVPTLSGTPTTVGSYTFRVTETDTMGTSAKQDYTVTINPAVSIATTSVAPWTAGLAGYSQTISAAGGTGTLTFSTTGTLPPGLSMSGGGVLSGTPTTAGSYTFAVTATDSVGATGSQTYTATVNPAVAITTTSLANWTVGTSGYGQTISASGGTGNITFATTAGTVPTGLTLSSAGVLSGTPTTASSYTFTVTATDTEGATANQNYTVTINPAVAIPAGTLASWTVNQGTYSQTISATGGTGSKTFATTSSTLPAGLTLSSSGVLSGTPMAAGSYTFTVTATDTVGATANQSYTVTINPAVHLTTTALAGWTVNVPSYSQTISATGGTGSLTITSAGTLPTGLALSSSGVLSGTPTTAGNYTFTVTSTDTVGASDSHSLTVTINPAVAIATTSLANGAASAAYNQTIMASGGTGALSFSQTGGTLPTGLTLSGGGVLSGTPTANGSYTFQVTATDTLGALDSHTYTVVVSTIGLSPATLANWTVNQPGYGQTVTASSGTAPYTFSTTAGTLPAGLTLSAGGALTGTPSTTGSFNFTLTATDSMGGTGTQNYSVTINPAITFASSALSAWTVSQAGYNQTISALGGTGSKTFTTTAGTLPTGLTLSSTGVLSGTPTVAGSYPFTVTATDAVGATASQNNTVTINPPVSITTVTLANWTVNLAGYSQTISTSGGTGSPTFATTAGTLPTGLTLSAGGILSGTPTAAGNYTFTVTATDTVGASDAKMYTVTISAAAATQLFVTAQPTATAGTSFNLTVTAQDGGGHTVGSFSGTVTLSSSLGADIAPTSVTLSGGTATVPVTLTAAGSQVLTAASPGLTSGTATVTVSPGPLGQYLVSVPASSTVAAGTGFLVAVQAADAFGNPITSYSGPASATASLSPTSTASNFPTSVAIGPSGLGLFLANLHTVGTYTITVSSGSISGSAGPVTVTPGRAVKLGFATQPVSTPTGVSLPAVTVQVQDFYGNPIATDNSDTVVVGVASGPGPLTAASTTSAPVHNGAATFNNLALLVPGSYTLSAAVPFLYTGPNSTSFKVTPLQVVPGSFASSPSGFSLQFNAPYLVNSVTPVLFGQGFGATAPAPSMTLTQTKDGSGNPVNNPVEGSLILNTATNGITFLATNTAYQTNVGSPVLPDGTYTVDLSSSAAANGFQALNSGGGFLDGLGSGVPGSGDYTTSFTVNVSATGEDVLWVPATADGPGQALNAPGGNQTGAGYPVYLNDGTGAVTNVQVTLNYDPTLLTVSGVTGAGFALLGSSAPGHALLQYSGPALPAGSKTPIGFLTASVPSGTTANPTPYRAKDLLHLSGASLNGGTIPVATSDGLHVVAYVGDGDGNGSYSSNDAVLITRVSLQTDSGFAAYPLIDPVIVADTDGAGFIPADAPLQANEAGVGFPTANLTIPPVPAGVHFQTIADNVDPRVTIPDVLNVGSNGTVLVPVNIDDAHPDGSTGLIEAHLALTYDPSLFTVSAADVHAGSVLAGGDWSVVPTIDQTTGQIGIALSSSTPILSTQGGSLVTIDFHPIDHGEPSGVSRRRPGQGTIALVASVNPTGQQVVSTELEDAQGTFTLAPAPTNSFDPRIDRVVLLRATQAPEESSSLGPQPAGVEVESASVEGHAGNLVSPAETLTEASGPGVPATTSGTSDQDSITAPSIGPVRETGTVHAGVAAGHGTASVTVGLSTAGIPAIAAPMAGWVLQLGSAQALNALAAGATGAPTFAEQMYLASLVSNPALVAGTSAEVLDRVVASRTLLCLPETDKLDLLWDNAAPDLPGQSLEQWPARAGRAPNRETATDGSTPAACASGSPGTLGERAALDRCFAQMAEALDEGTGDD